VSRGSPLDDVARRSLAEWLESRLGDRSTWLLTWTFAPTWSEQPTISALLRSARLLELELVKRECSYFTAAERGSLRERLHLHTLADASLEDVQAWWRSRRGFTTCRGPVSSSEGAALYVTKYLVKAPMAEPWQPVMAGGPAFFGQAALLG